MELKKYENYGIHGTICSWVGAFTLLATILVVSSIGFNDKYALIINIIGIVLGGVMAIIGLICGVKGCEILELENLDNEQKKFTKKVHKICIASYIGSMVAIFEIMVNLIILFQLLK